MAEGGVGYSCIAGALGRNIWQGAPKTPFLKFGDRVRIEMFDAQTVPSSAPSIRKW
jgi:fumarylacetoacetate (FAA) hydrolase